MVSSAWDPEKFEKQERLSKARQFVDPLDDSPRTKDAKRRLADREEESAIKAQAEVEKAGLKIRQPTTNELVVAALVAIFLVVGGAVASWADVMPGAFAALGGVIFGVASAILFKVPSPQPQPVWSDRCAEVGGALLVFAPTAVASATSLGALSGLLLWGARERSSGLPPALGRTLPFVLNGLIWIALAARLYVRTSNGSWRFGKFTTNDQHENDPMALV